MYEGATAGLIKGASSGSFIYSFITEINYVIHREPLLEPAPSLSVLSERVNKVPGYPYFGLTDERYIISRLLPLSTFPTFLNAATYHCRIIRVRRRYNLSQHHKPPLDLSYFLLSSHCSNRLDSSTISPPVIQDKGH